MIKEGDLLAHLDGISSKRVASHLEQCAACREEMAALQTIDKTFKQVLRRISCPKPQMLLLYETNLLPKPKQRKIAKHVADCPHCQREVSQLTRVPFDKPLSTVERWVQMGKKILEALLLPPPALAIVRGDQAGKDAVYQDGESAVYQAGDYQIMLATNSPFVPANIWEIEGHIINLHDQFVPYDGHVCLQKNTKNIATDKIDEFGYFILENVSPGEYTLQIDLPTTIIPIKKFVIP
ncbi:MAG: anti-sigma factor family protein [Ardenticatenaceae bacterium]